MSDTPYVFQSKHFQGGDPRIRACADNPSADIRRGQSGKHVGLVQAALAAIRESALAGRHSLPAPPEVAAKEREAARYDGSTADAVRRYKADRSIINYTYQTAADDIVGRLTLHYLDEEMRAVELGLEAEKEPARDFLIEIDGDAALSGDDISDGPGAKESARRVEAVENYVARHGKLTVINFKGGFQATDPTLKVLEKFDAARKGMKKVGRILVTGTSAGGRSAVRVARGISGRGFTLALVALNDASFDEGDELLTNPGHISCLPKLSFFQGWSFTIDPGKEFHGTPAGFTPKDLTKEVDDIKAQYEALAWYVKQSDTIRTGYVNNAHVRACNVGGAAIRGMIAHLLAP